MRNFIPDKQLDGNIETAVDAIKLANKLDVWYPRGFTLKGSKTKEDVWFDSIKIFREKYCNSIEVGYKELYKMSKTRSRTIFFW